MRPLSNLEYDDSSTSNTINKFTGNENCYRECEIQNVTNQVKICNIDYVSPSSSRGSGPSSGILK